MNTDHYYRRLTKGMETFYYTTGLGILITDITFEQYYYSKGFLSPDYLQCLGFHELKDFITQIATEPVEEETSFFHTFYTSNDIIYNFLILQNDQSAPFAVITNPMILEDYGTGIPVMKDDSASIQEKIAIRQAIKSLFTVSINQIYHYGLLMLHLTKLDFEKLKVKQIVHGSGDNCLQEEYDDKVPLVSFSRSEQSKHIPYELSLELANRMKQGDLAGVRAITDKFYQMPWDQLVENNTLRSLKNNCITACSGFCYLAIDSNAPYYQMFQLADGFINEIEKINSAKLLLDQIIKMALTFTKAIILYSRNNYSKQVRDCLNYIQNNFHKKIGLKDLANQINRSPGYLSKLIKKDTGLSVTELINKVRIEESKFLMTRTNYSLCEIAIAVGFSYQNHFSRVFKQIEGMPPQEYRSL